VDLGLKDKLALVTGGSRGIGLAIVQALVAEGAQVVVGARRSSAGLDALAADGAVRVVEVDLSAPSGPADLVAAVGDQLDILVNNVGGAPSRPGGFLSITDEDWQRTLDLNLMTTVRATRSALPVMLAAGRGTIVNVNSVNAFLPDPLVMDYSAAKGAAWNFAKSLSKEFGPRGIRVNSICPGPVATDLWLGAGGVAATVAWATGATPEDIVAGATAGMLTGRFSQPAEIADLVVLLASDRTANVTGSAFTIDGGLITTL
jgi:NAD(P)-dependent dehydrogenase (short-subunit alcohol dehydrogenase family)